MKKILSVILTVVEVIFLVRGFVLCYPYSAELYKTDYDSFINVFCLGFLYSTFIFEVFPRVVNSLVLIFRKIRKTLEKQGKE